MSNWTYDSTAFQKSSSPESSDFDCFLPVESGFEPGFAPGFGVALVPPGFGIPAMGGSGGAFAFGFGRPAPGTGDAGLRAGVWGFDPSSMMSSSSGSGGTGIDPDFVIVDLPAEPLELIGRTGFGTGPFPVVAAPPLQALQTPRASRTSPHLLQRGTG